MLGQKTLGKRGFIFHGLTDLDIIEMVDTVLMCLIIIVHLGLVYKHQFQHTHQYMMEALVLDTLG